MKRLLRPNIGVLALGVAAPLAACSSIPESILASAAPPIPIRLESEPPGAEARTSLGQSCRTPCSVTVAPSGDFAVTFSLNGYQPQTVPVRAQASLDGIENEMGPDLMRAHTRRHNVGPPALAANPVHAELQKAAPAPTRKQVARKPQSTAASAEPVNQ